MNRYFNTGIFAKYNEQLIPIRSIGDTLGLTTIVKRLFELTGVKTKVVTMIPEIFYNNPYVEATYIDNNVDNVLFPCGEYDCNIIQHYANQLDIDLPENSVPELYFNYDEIVYVKEELKDFDGKIKIAVCLNSSAKSRDLEYEYIRPLLEKLKNDGYVLILFGLNDENNEIYDRSYGGKTTLRQSFALMSGCDFYLGVDTGLFHVMAALSKPQFVFFRNAGCSNNAYHNTYFFESNISCGFRCRIPAIAECYARNKCMNNFNLDDYYNLIIEKFPYN